MGTRSRRVTHPAIEQITLAFVLQLFRKPANLEIHSLKIIRPEIVDELKIVIVVRNNLAVQVIHGDESDVQVIICTGYIFQLLGGNLMIMVENDPRSLQFVKVVRNVLGSYDEGAAADTQHVSSTDTAH